MTGGTLLAVFAHPDDESLAAGGLIARHTASGGRATVVTATWAEGTVRAVDLAAAVRAVGAGAPRMLGYADERVPESAPGRPRLVDARLDESAAALAAHISELRPDVIVTHDHHGGITGHADHLRTHQLTMRAIELAASSVSASAGDPWRPTSVLLSTHPRSSVPRLRELVGPRRAVHTVPDEEVTLRLDVTPWLEAKLAAVLAHRAEVERGALPGVVARMTHEDRAELLGTEWYVECRPNGPAQEALS